MYELSLENFRGFKEQPFVQVRPLTLLIGENSAGKSSFLAALKFALDFSSAGRQTPSFNKDPFQLGTFQQIAHVRGGKAGRAKNFSISLRTPLRGTRGRNIEQPVCLRMNFGDVESHAAVSEIKLSVGAETLSVRFESKGIAFYYQRDDGDAVILAENDSPMRFHPGDFFVYWPFILREVRVGFKGGGAKEPQFQRAQALAETAERLAMQMQGIVQATSAIRTKPLRTYTPGTEIRDGEGSHVPFEIAKLFRGKKPAWRKLKSSIERFGTSAEMFKEVSVKTFGKSVSDPFQIQFSIDSPKMNIVDLGYGTSQILPILYEVSIAPARSRFLVQQPEVHLHPKAQAALGSYFVDAFREEKKEFVLETHSDFIVDRVRQSIAVGEIKSSDVSILFFEHKHLETRISQINLDETGQPIEPPDEYRSFFLGEQMRNLGIDV